MSDINTKQESFADLFEKSCSAPIWSSKITNGKIIGFDGHYVIVDVGLKSEGRIDIKEFCIHGKMPELNIGDDVEVFIDRYEDKSGSIVLSKEKALKESAWERYEEAQRDRSHVTGYILSKVKGGFMVDLSGTMAFLPGSQVDNHAIDVNTIMNSPQTFIILKVDKERGNVVVSRRAVLDEANAGELEKTIASLEEGNIVSGIVKNITTYGAFIDIGGIDGLLHNSDISWKRLVQASDVFETGQRIDVKITKLNRENNRISLGLKQMEKDPWEGVEQEFSVGSKVSGKVTNVTDYGIFVEIKNGIEGLVYLSEISWKKGISPQKAASIGDVIDVVILECDMNKRRIGLGMKQLVDNPWVNIEKEFSIGQEIETVVSHITDFGLFVRITDDVDGMIHMNDIVWGPSNPAVLSKYEKGQTVRAKILDIVPEREKISLGIKQLTDDPYQEAAVGSVITCTISEIKEEGLYVTLSNGLNGFIKRAEWALDKQDRRVEMFSQGEKIDAKVMSINKNGEVLLSIKVLEIENVKNTVKQHGSESSGAVLGDILGNALNNVQKKK